VAEALAPEIENFRAVASGVGTQDVRPAQRRLADLAVALARAADACDDVERRQLGAAAVRAFVRDVDADLRAATDAGAPKPRVVHLLLDLRVAAVAEFRRLAPRASVIEARP
jgi:hypothetical protein